MDRPRGLQGGARGDAGQVARGPARVRARVRALLLPRRRGGGDAPARSAEGRGPARAARTSTSRRSGAQIAEALRDGRTGRDARPRAAGDRGLRPRRGLRACSVSTCSGSAARSACAPSPSPICPTTTRAATASRATQLRRFEAPPAARARARPDRAHAPRCRPRGRSTSSTARCPPDRRRTSRRCTASSPSSSAGSRRRGTSCAGRKRHAHVDVRRTMRASLQTGGVPVELKYRPSGRDGPRSSCSATSRPASRARARSSSACCTRCTTRSASCARSCSSSGSPRSPTSSSASATSAPPARRSAATPASPTSPGYTDYGRVWTEFLALIEDDLHPRATVIVLGDARTNGRPPRDDVFAAITAQGRPHVLAQPRAASVLELRRLGDRRLRAALRGVRVLAHRPARGLRQGADDAGRPLLIAGADAPVVCVPVCRSPGGSMLPM